MEIIPQGVWRWKIAAYLFLAGMGAGAFIIGVVADFTGYPLPARIGMTFGVPAVAFSTLFLIWDLGHPEKFYTAMLHPASSWISRGFFILSGLIVFGGLTIILWVWPFSSVLSSSPGPRAVLEVIALVFAVATCIYTGILIGIVVSRPFWNSPLLPILFLISAVSTGIGGLFFITPIVAAVGGIDARPSAAFMDYIALLDMALIILEAIAVYLYLAVVFDRAPEAANLLLRGPLSGLFWGGFIVVGLLLPLCIEYLSSVMSDAAGRMVSAPIAGILLIFGGFLLRSLVLAAGIRSPLIVRVPFRVRPGV